MPPVLNDTSRTTCRSLYTSFGISFLFMPSQPRMQFNRRDSTGEKIELAKSINGQACRINTKQEVMNHQSWEQNFWCSGHQPAFSSKPASKSHKSRNSKKAQTRNSKEMKRIQVVVHQRWKKNWANFKGKQFTSRVKLKRGKQSIYDWILRRNQSIPATNEAADCPSFLSSPCNFAMASVPNSMFFTPNMQTDWPCAAGS